MQFQKFQANGEIALLKAKTNTRNLIKINWNPRVSPFSILSFAAINRKWVKFKCSLTEAVMDKQNITSDIIIVKNLIKLQLTQF